MVRGYKKGGETQFAIATKAELSRPEGGYGSDLAPLFHMSGYVFSTVQIVGD